MLLAAVKRFKLAFHKEDQLPFRVVGVLLLSVTVNVPAC